MPAAVSLLAFVEPANQRQAAARDARFLAYQGAQRRMQALKHRAHTRSGCPRRIGAGPTAGPTAGAETHSPDLRREALAGLDPPEVRRRVRAAVQKVGRAYVGADEPVGVLHHTPAKGLGELEGFVLQRSLGPLAAACSFCQDMDNLRIDQGLVTALYCRSCQTRISQAADTPRCPGTAPSLGPAGGCGNVLWINSLGLPSALCSSCDKAAVPA